MSKKKLYASFDIEADGEVPVKNSMLSIGIVFFEPDGKEIKSYQRNLLPLSDRVQDPKCMSEFWSKHPESWKFVTSNQIDAKDFVKELEDILTTLNKTYDISFVAHPAAYDWQWLKSYYELFKSESAPNLGFSARCASTLFWTYCKQNNIISKKDLEEFRKTLSAGFTLTHNPEDDAREQGTVFINLCKKMNISL
ncbi:MAG: hypothetical protein Edafosvirus5_12 [Edafosvirus sp.]|uniref:3'-5' exoribonuclease Rv2179c-like domain-containing protein n=1 Tax=Edafosvirus sp. TaxID=2487765 RepID=A0A3G4ZUV2_9VIRU|nr:MAG: hypothetical protein Edafosvirus5_12 [Edafosvirus sp.]